MDNNAGPIVKEDKKEEEERKDERDALPTVRVSEISRLADRVISERLDIMGVDVEWVDVNTQGMTYLRLKYDLENMSVMHR